MDDSARGKSRSAATDRPEVLAQAGAIAYRVNSAGATQVLLIRRRHKRRWGIPKGFIDAGHTARQTALQEAHEEAGLAGDLWTEPIGLYEYTRMDRDYRVVVYPLIVTREYDHYEEEAFRERQWFGLDAALERKLRKGIRPLLARLSELLTEPPPSGSSG